MGNSERNSQGENKDIPGKNELLKGEFWRDHAMNELIPNWYKHARDKEHGAFYMNLSRDWQPIPSWDKVPAMISRHVFGFTTAYLFSGEDKYLEVAKEGVDYLLEKAWDKEYGGWFDTLAQTGEPKDTAKSTPLQLYTNVGLTLYYIATGDNKALSYVMKSIEIMKSNGYDDKFDGYYGALNRDLSVKDDGKNKHAHFGYVGSLLLNLWLATRDPEVLQLESHMTDLTLERMLDPEEGWVLGSANHFNRYWECTPMLINGTGYIAIGAQLTAALSFLRLYHQTGKETYRENGKLLGKKIISCGWDPEKHVWLDMVEKKHPYSPVEGATIQWWNQIYGSFLQMQLYNVTHEEEYLDRFIKTESIYFERFIDKEYGGVFTSVTPEGELIGNGDKAVVWHASYHEMEHALLNYLFLNLYVNKVPAVLHLKLSNTEPGKKHFVSLVDDPSVRIAQVKLNGEPWNKFDAGECSVTLPEGKDLRVEVTFASGNN